jgi:hypothetical protein
MRKLSISLACAFALGILSQGASATGCHYESFAKKNDLEPPAPTAAVVKQQAQKKQDEET